MKHWPDSLLSSENVFEIIGALKRHETTDRLFNQYVSRTQYDLDDAPNIRTRNLEGYLSSFNEAPRTLVLAEAPGPWGCRFTGLPITSELHLQDETFPLHGTVCTEGPARREYSASIFWRVLQTYHPSFLVWNSVPFHPHKVGHPDSIRPPTNSELIEFGSITKMVIELVQPSQILAMGRRPEKQLKTLECESTYIRHPSQGGATAFEAGMIEAFS